jgi:hypothetical protein
MGLLHGGARRLFDPASDEGGHQGLRDLNVRHGSVFLEYTARRVGAHHVCAPRIVAPLTQ